MAKLVLALCLLLIPFNCIIAQSKDKNAEQDLLLAQQLKKQFGDNTTIACARAYSIISFDTIGSTPKASMDETEEFISLKNDYTFTDVLGCNENENVSGITVEDNKNKPVYTNIFDQSNEHGEDFYSDERLRVFQVNFPIEGSRRICREQTIITDLRYLTQHYFINDYPVIYDSVVFNVPYWLNIEFKEMNFEGYDIKKTITKDDKNKLTAYTYVIRNAPKAYFDEDNVPGASYMFPHVLIMCKSYTRADGKNINILSSINDMYTWYEKLIKETGNDDAVIKPLVNSIIAGKTSNIEKAKAIYYWVEDNIRYVAFENGIVGYKPAPCQTVYKDKFGDCKCMANLLTEMLKLAGLDARRAWLGTKSIAYDISTPSLAIHNHAICLLVLNGKHYYLDATAGYASLGYNNDMIQGRDIIFENGNSYTAEKIPVAPINNNETVINKKLSINGTNITGNARYVYNGDSKTYLLYEYNHTSGSDKEWNMKHFIEHYDQNISLLTNNISDMEDKDDPLSINYSFSMKNQVTQFDKDTYVGIDNDRILEKLEFDSNRHCDYQFDYRINYNINDTLIVPAGYTVKHIPDELNISNADFSFIIKTTQVGDKIIYHKEIKILNEILKKQNFDKWNAAIKQLKNICSDQIILSQS